ncbi:hypothetical protein [Streptomyces spirodelae]|uniref:Uncharacterized protein n=1 Tax=Streptomyces spirodelae TaxID=2812904 RepID=A0ABS3X3X2_9ACTN|nr:hypothetical protein [Streptomyces spirodelae]MBO8190076.1 hypothetical protein [Streptomyces spirodelae]
MNQQITEQSVSYLHWHRDGGLLAVMKFPAGTPREAITTWSERVAQNGGAAVEVYEPNPTPPTTEEDRARFARKLAAARAARLARN